MIEGTIVNIKEDVVYKYPYCQKIIVIIAIVCIYLTNSL